MTPSKQCGGSKSVAETLGGTGVSKAAAANGIQDVETLWQNLGVWGMGEWRDLGKEKHSK